MTDTQGARRARRIPVARAAPRYPAALPAVLPPSSAAVLRERPPVTGVSGMSEGTVEA